MTSVIRGGTLVTADLSTPADIRIENGRIAEIGENLKGTRVLDAHGCLVMPGGIDPHVHLEMPFMGTHSIDTFESGTCAALAGGTTFVIDFCLPAPGQSLLDALHLWQKKSQKACTDYHYHMGITWWHEDITEQMTQIVSAGIRSFKHFMAYKGALMLNDAQIFDSFRQCAHLSALPMVHAENGDVIQRLQDDYTKDSLKKGHPLAHALSRPPEVEGEAVNRAALLSHMAGVPLYVVHVSSRPAHNAICRARQKGWRVFGESLIQHLLISDAVYQTPCWDTAAHHVMSPPFRAVDHQESLWCGLRSGTLQVVATDHCAFTTAQKRMGRTDFTKIPNGTGALEHRLSLLWTHGVAQGRLTPEEFVALTSTNAAKLFNLYPRKGALRVGSDADILVWDPKCTGKIELQKHHSRSDFSLFDGWSISAQPRFVLSRGKLCFEENTSLAEPGHGRFCPARAAIA